MRFALKCIDFRRLCETSPKGKSIHSDDICCIMSSFSNYLQIAELPHVLWQANEIFITHGASNMAITWWLYRRHQFCSPHIPLETGIMSFWLWLSWQMMHCQNRCHLMPHRSMNLAPAKSLEKPGIIIPNFSISHMLYEYIVLIHITLHTYQCIILSFTICMKYGLLITEVQIQSFLAKSKVSYAQ